MKTPFLRNAVTVSHLLMEGHIKAGNIALDATCGKGNDTLFLAGLVGDRGQVYGFDLQAEAIEHTKQKLMQNNLLNRVKLINDSHENLNLYINQPIDAAMFNLGFLPGAESKLVTLPHTTLKAVQQVLTMLNHGGLITIVFYPGHRGGQEELNIVKDYLISLPQASFEVSQLSFINQINNPPQLIAIYKL